MIFVRKSLIGLAFMVAIVGCDSASTVSASASTGTGEQTGSGKPDTSATTPPPQSPTSTPAEIASATKQATPSVDNPNRVNQLKDLKKVDLKAAGQVVHAWIMDNETKREEGMMFLVDKDVKENQGMIFVFPEVQSMGPNHGFWMHNCPMGLDIIYIDAKHRVINIGDGVPQSDASVAAKADYTYVLEVKRGWSKRHGLKPHDLVTIPGTLKTTE